MAVLFLGAAPGGAAGVAAAVPGPSASPVAARTLSVVCERTPLWLFVPGDDRPTRTAEPEAQLGQRFGWVSGPRATLSGFEFYETDITVVQPGFAPGTHYWLSRACAIAA